MLHVHYGTFGHNDMEGEAKKKEEEGYTEEHAQRPAEIENFVFKEFENERFGPWMIAKKKYRKYVNAKMDGNIKHPVEEVSRDSTGINRATGSRIEV